jgi:filamentous hemagglutinin family protein
MNSLDRKLLGLGITVSSFAILSINSATAQVIPDNTLPTNSEVITQSNIIGIQGGTRSASNLFHSFSQFSVPSGVTAEFRGTESIQNIITRVTGNSLSQIDGILKAQGTANLFLINPNGVVFGPNAALQIGGSFIGSTADSVNFDNGVKFSATDTRTTNLLLVSAPVGLQFGRNANSVVNQSGTLGPGIGTTRNTNVGLRVPIGKTLALVGGEIKLEGGSLTAESGRIELGSVDPNSTVNLNFNSQNLSLGYENIRNFQNISITTRNADGTSIPSILNASSVNSGSGTINLQGNNITISGDRVSLSTMARGSSNGGDLTINAKKLSVINEASVSTSTIARGNAGNLIINASETVEVINSINPVRANALSQLNSATGSDGKAGDIRITTSKLRILNGGRITAESATINRPDQLIPAEGRGGNIFINASDSIEIAGFAKNSTPIAPSSITASTSSFGNAGAINILTGQLIIQDQGSIISNIFPTSRGIYQGDPNNPGSPGAINIKANSIFLNNQGRLLSVTGAGNGGNISLQVQDLLLMLGKSQISTSAGIIEKGGNGGNITISAPRGFLVTNPLGNNDISANAYSGTGGNVRINARQIYGFTPRSRSDLERLLNTNDPSRLDPQFLPTSDITAISQQNPSLSGSVQINTPYADPSKGLVELSGEVVDVSRQIDAGCGSGGRAARSSFIATGKGGLVPSPTEPLTSDVALTNWISLEDGGQIQASRSKNIAELEQIQKNVTEAANNSEQIVEAQGWVIDANGKVALVAQVPNVEPHNLSFNTASCLARE